MQDWKPNIHCMKEQNIEYSENTMGAVGTGGNYYSTGICIAVMMDLKRYSFIKYPANIYLRLVVVLHKPPGTPVLQQ